MVRASGASLWGGAGDQSFQACAVTKDGVAIIGGSGAGALSIDENNGKSLMDIRDSMMLRWFVSDVIVNDENIDFTTRFSQIIDTVQ